MIAVMLLVACGETPTEAPPPATAVPPTEEPEAQLPSELNIAAILTIGLEEGWDRSWYDSMQRVIDQKPYGLDITLDYTEGVWGDEAELVLREYAETGKYEIIFATSTFSDQVKNLKDDYPDILWVVHGSGNEALGDNVFWVYMRVYEPAYCLGILAGRMTESNVLGAVGAFAFDDVNDEINAFFAGAKSVNPDVQQKVTFIESWYDPAKALEAATAQAAAGVDFIWQASGAFETCVENDVYCFAHHLDQNFLAPDHVVNTAVALWDPSILYVIDQWRDFVLTGNPYDAPREKLFFPMAEGGADLAPWHGMDQKFPAEVIDEVNQCREDILSGKLTVPLNVEPPASD
jgi:basic membrane lipoprotein Med (substrate-binding protein (PBP1-ABC) superfamily)